MNMSHNELKLKFLSFDDSNEIVINAPDGVGRVATSQLPASSSSEQETPNVSPAKQLHSIQNSNEQVKCEMDVSAECSSGQPSNTIYLGGPKKRALAVKKIAMKTVKKIAMKTVKKIAIKTVKKIAIKISKKTPKKGKQSVSGNKAHDTEMPSSSQTFTLTKIKYHVTKKQMEDMLKTQREMAELQDLLNLLMEKDKQKIADKYKKRLKKQSKLQRRMIRLEKRKRREARRLEREKEKKKVDDKVASFLASFTIKRTKK